VLDAVAAVIKLFFIPGSLSFLLAGVTVGVLLAAGVRPFRRAALAGLGAIVLLYWILSIPVVADTLATRFHERTTPRSTTDVHGCDVIVVLGAGISSVTSNGQTLNIPDSQTAFNAFEGARIYHLFPTPVPVVASGGIPDFYRQKGPESLVIRGLMVTAGVPDDGIVLDSDSRTTHEQAVNIAAMARQRGWQRIALVAPPVQMARAAGAFAREGLPSIVRAEAPFQSDADGRQGSRWLPSTEALWISQRALYDYLGWMYYWSRGWLR
jgi:uncharacterized SAM-binding protein YcdF (DUF218 family)